MNLKRILFMLLIAILSLSPGVYSRDGNPGKTSSSPSDKSVEPFLGRWDLTLKAPDREYPSWLELRQEGGQLKAEMVGRWGNARPLPKVEISNGHLTFVSPKEEEDRPEDPVTQEKQCPEMGQADSLVQWQRFDRMEDGGTRYDRVEG